MTGGSVTSAGDSPPPACELCSSPALLYCQADQAFLCQACDTRVHAANLIVVKHIRSVLCQGCTRDTSFRVTGPGWGSSERETPDPSWINSPSNPPRSSNLHASNVCSFPSLCNDCRTSEWARSLIHGRACTTNMPGHPHVQNQRGCFIVTGRSEENHFRLKELPALKKARLLPLLDNVEGITPMREANPAEPARGCCDVYTLDQVQGQGSCPVRQAVNGGVHPSGKGMLLPVRRTSSNMTESPASPSSLCPGHLEGKKFKGKRSLPLDSECLDYVPVSSGNDAATPSKEDSLVQTPSGSSGTMNTEGDGGSNASSVGSCNNRESSTMSQGSLGGFSSIAGHTGPPSTPTGGERMGGGSIHALHIPETSSSASNGGQHGQDALRKGQAFGGAASWRLRRVLLTWSNKLGGVNAATLDAAFQMFHRSLLRLKREVIAASFLRVTLASCLWLAMKLVEPRAEVPGAKEVAKVTAVEASSLKDSELAVLKILDWQPLKKCM